MPAGKDVGVVIGKAIGAESEVVAADAASGGYTLYGALVSAKTTAAQAILTPVINGSDVDFPLFLEAGTVGNTQSVALPAPIKCESIKATLVGADTTMHIFYGP